MSLLNLLVWEACLFLPPMANVNSRLQQWYHHGNTEHFHTIRTVDMHTEGEPLRVIVDGLPELRGNSILEYRRYMRENLDEFRTALMWEPRGHADMYGCVITPPESPEADFGVLFIHNEGYSTMCGHAIIALATLAVETRMVPVTEPETRVRIDAPAGLITAWAKVREGKVTGAYFHNVPSFVPALDEKVVVPGLGTVSYDLAYGGAFYAYVQADSLGLSLAEDNFREIIRQGMAIKEAVIRNADNILHPFQPDLSFLYGTIFISHKVGSEEAGSRNVCVFAEGEVDRSPTGTGVSGRLAIHYARGEIALEDYIVIESIIGSKFSGKVVRGTRYGPFDAIIPQVEGRAFITGRHEFLISSNDPLKKGFILR